MYAVFCTMLFGTIYRIFGRGQVNSVYRTPASVTQKITAQVKLRHTRTIRYWFHDSRPGRPAQSYSGMAG
jgi:hypothetical protein